MFTGIIQNSGKVESITKHRHGMTLAFRFQVKENRVQKGESISVNGVCLTAIQINANGFKADVVPETLAVTNLGQLKVRDEANLERALRLGDPIGGHFVTGHIDAVGKIAEICSRGGNWSLLLHAPKTIISKLVVKGSVACEGVSLTIQSVTSTGFRVAVIPHTLAVTTLGKKKVGDQLNLEIDPLARSPKKSSLSIRMLEKQGF